MNVVLVHGIFDYGSIFTRLKLLLEQDGHRCWTPSLNPCDGREGIADLSEKLQVFIERHIDSNSSLVIVGFSMGCIVARYYLQVLGGYHRTKAFFSISGPHSGTLTAYLYFGQGAKDMQPGSSLLSHLKGTESCLRNIPLFVYWTSFDSTIIPASSCNWLLAPEHQRFNTRALLHRFMPSNRLVCVHIRRQLRLLKH